MALWWKVEFYEAWLKSYNCIVFTKFHQIKQYSDLLEFVLKISEIFRLDILINILIYDLSEIFSLARDWSEHVT